MLAGFERWFVLKVGSSKNEKSNERPSATAPRKADSVSKQATSATLGPKDGPDHARTQPSSSFILIESDKDDEKPQSDQVLCVAAALRKNAPADASVSFPPPRDYGADFDTGALELIRLAEKAMSKRPVSFSEIKTKGKGKGLLKINKPFTKQGCYSKVSSMKVKEKTKNADTTKGVSSYSGTSSKNTGRDSQKTAKDDECERLDEAEAKAELRRRRRRISKTGRDSQKTTAKDDVCERLDEAEAKAELRRRGRRISKTGRDSQKTTAKDDECERLDEAEAKAELRRRRRQFASEVGSSRGKESDEECRVNISKKNPRRGRGGKGSTRENDRHQKRRKVSESTRNKHVDYVSLSSNETSDSLSKSKFSCSGANASLQVSCYGAEHVPRVGIAYRTRSKVGANKKPAQAASKVLLDSSTVSESSSSDSGDDSLDENLEPGSSDNDIEFLDSHIEVKDGSTSAPETKIPEVEALKAKEWEVTMYQDEVAASQGIKIRRRPATGPPQHYVGPFEFRLQNEGNTARNILEEIVWNKDVEVAQMKERKSFSVLKKLLDKAPPTRDFIGALKEANSRTGFPGLIAEVKKASPSRGVLREAFDPVQIAKAYEKGGAACLSVLTDEKYFKGSFENLKAIRDSGVQCPLLCKEFVIDAWQIYYARVNGADAILLIAAILPDLDINYMTKICKMFGLTALVEVHDEREMDRVMEIEGVELIGINNRDLETFELDIATTKKLLEGDRGRRIREKGITVVGESGLFTPADIAYVQEAGVKAVLVGESLVKQADPGAGIAQLFGKDISL